MAVGGNSWCPKVSASASLEARIEANAAHDLPEGDAETGPLGLSKAGRGSDLRLKVVNLF